MNKKRAVKAKPRGVATDITTAMADNYNKLDFKFKKRDFKFTERQQQLIEIMKDPANKIVIVEGPAGVSKTILAVYCGLTLLKDQKIDKLLYIRSVVESAHKSLGFLPGSLDEKMEMWRQPLDDKFEELVESKDIVKLRTTDKIEVVPINYIRGASWRSSFVIFDEFQNTLLSEAKTILTRIGENTQLILLGDAAQADIKDSGFKQVYNAFDDEESRSNGVATFKFTEEDIVRSEIVKFVVHKFKSLEG
jgi:phosphate starvation-inducible PhoH-like protein